MIEFVLFAVFGLIAGIFTGLIPGVHPNALAVLILASSGFLLTMFSPISIAVFIISLGITHTFLSFIPSVFLGAPETDTALSILPGHRFLLEGKAYEAVYLTVVGGVGVIILSIIFFPVLALVLPFFYNSIRSYIAFILMGIALVMILTEKGKKKLIGLFVFLISGILGVVVLNMPILNSNFLLFPVFTGLFGISTMLISLNSGVNVPEQCLEKVHIPKRMSISGMLKGFFSGMLVGILPGIGAAQAGILTSEISRKKDVKEFLISLGGINTVAALFSLMALYLISKPRSGIAIAVEKIVENFGLNELILMMLTCLFVVGISAIITLKIAKGFSKLVQKINYKKLSMLIIVFLVILTIILTGLPGILLLFVSTVIGILPPLMSVKRTHSMGILMLPIMMFYLGI